MFCTFQTLKGTTAWKVISFALSSIPQWEGVKLSWKLSDVSTAVGCYNLGGDLLIGRLAVLSSWLRLPKSYLRT